MENIIKVENLSKKIKKNYILKNISFNLRKGSITGFIGPNGAGKTTTLKALTGLVKINNGTILINNKKINSIPSPLKKIGSIIEYPIFYPFMSGYDNLKACALLLNLSKKEREEKIEKVLKIVNLVESKDIKVKNYSLGMKQRLGIAQSILDDPDILLLDEPTNGLDPFGIRELREIILNINKNFNKTILISSHYLDELQNICDEIIVINNGQIIFSGSKETLLNINMTNKLDEAFFKIIGGKND